MPRVLGLAFASKIYKRNKDLHAYSDFSNQGNEIAWGTIGNASTSEGHFWESINAAGVMQVPMLVSIWDDEYGISVHAKHQTTKQNLTAILSGFKTDKFGTGIELITVNGWDYPALLNAYKKASEVCRKKHTPVVIHVKELTQPQGHSTSGSHERYKSKDRLAWESDHDCIAKMRAWVIDSKLSTDEKLSDLEKEIELEVKEARKLAWATFRNEIKEEANEAIQLLKTVDASIAQKLQESMDPGRKDILKALHEAIRQNLGNPAITELKGFYKSYLEKYQNIYSSHLHSESDKRATNIPEIKPEYSHDTIELNGFEILNKTFDTLLTKYPEVIAFGEDVGKIGDVNQGFAGLQEKHGENRVMDMGIRENTIVGQAIGASLRGLRPIAEIQYLDYLLYGIQTMSDDIATIQYRTKGGQKYPLIIRTRGHRLEGIWHSGSPMGMILNALRGMHVLVPRDMTRAAGFYNTMIQSDEPALIIECLNGYRLKEKLPSNIDRFTTPVGVPEVLNEGSDVTVVTYGSCLRIAQDSIVMLDEKGISVELIDVQSLLPFDINHSIVESIKKTNQVVFMDEDVKGGATAFMMQKVLEEQGGYRYLDGEPKTLTSQDHRPAYGTDGDYFSKSNAEELFDVVYTLMNESNPSRYPK
jgi:pyruvate/2-oxoglutarate/acetoin dehydrogenase E1 component